MMQFLNYEIKPCDEDDAEFFHEKAYCRNIVVAWICEAHVSIF